MKVGKVTFSWQNVPVEFPGATKAVLTGKAPVYPVGIRTDGLYFTRKAHDFEP